MLNFELTNIYSDLEAIYVFHRVAGELKIFQEHIFKNYYFEPSASGINTGHTGVKLQKFQVSKSWDIKNQASPAAYEADLSWHKRYILENINIVKTKIRWMMMDIETLSKDMPDVEVPTDPVSAISVFDNFDSKGQTFWLPNFKDEESMIRAWADYVKARTPDILFAYNGDYFDFPYLFNRFDWLAEYLSPIGKVEYSNKYPAGMACLDYLALLKKSMYRNKTYKRFGLPYVYADIAKTKPEIEKPFFGELSEDIKNKNINDVKMMVKLERHFNLVNFYDEQRLITKCTWNDFKYNSRLVDNLFLMDAHSKGKILPSKPKFIERGIEEEVDSIVGGHVYCKSGVYENVYCFDVGGAYPSVIQTFCLDPANKKSTPNSIKIRGINIDQNPDATMPSVCRKLMGKRKELKALLAVEKDDSKHKLLKQQDDAYKSLVNSVYGIALLQACRLYDEEIGAMITFLVRSLLRYSRYRLNKWGCEVIYGDTDSVMAKSTKPYQEVLDYLNGTILVDWLKKKGKNESCIKFGFDGTFKSVFFLTKKRYIGDIVDKNGKEEEKIKGLEMVRSDASGYQDVFQKELFHRIKNHASQADIIEWIKKEMDSFPEQKIEDISFPCKLGRDYKNLPIHVRALQYTQTKIDFKKRIGEDYYYTFIVPKDSQSKYKKVRKQGKKIISEIGYSLMTDEEKQSLVVSEKKVETPNNVLAFDLFHLDLLKDYQLDYPALIERNIMKKAEPIFEALGWDITKLEKEK